MLRFLLINLFGLLGGLLIGVPAGTSVATFIYADGISYLKNDPKACMNCHVMQSHYDSWMSSTHRSVATCNTCHTSGNIVSVYSQKALNGFLHSWAFTTGDFHEPLQIKGFNRKIALSNCLNCHSNFIENSGFGHSGFGKRDCLSCHQGVGHKRW